MQPDRWNSQAQSQTQGRAVGYDAGLRAHMQRIYNRMAAGVLVTALTAWIVASTPALMATLMTPPIVYAVIFAPLAIVWFGFNPMTMSSQKLALSFFGISVLYGISFSVLLFAFTHEAIFRAFFVATGMFAGLSIFGYTTKKNLDGLASFAIMGVWGVLIMTLLNGFIFKSESMFDLISVISIIAFSGITAWQTQAMKEMYHPGAGDEANSRMGWGAALNLYISFIVLFQNILRLMNSR